MKLNNLENGNIFHFLYKILLLLYDYLIYDYFLFIHIKPWLFIPYHYEFSNLLYN